MSGALHRFAETLRDLLAADVPERVEQLWGAYRIDDAGWRALHGVARSTDPQVVPILDEADGLLLRLRDRLPLLAAGRAGDHVQTFRLPAIERLQHATAAALVAHRFGTAGLATVVADVRSPIGRRYQALLLLARLHAGVSWPVFQRYLVPEAHHAFLGLAAEAARFYPAQRPAGSLLDLFESTRSDVLLRAFLGPRLLYSLFVLGDPVALPLYRELAVGGHTNRDPVHCEVTHALVMLRRLTGHIPPNTKFGEPSAQTSVWVEEAEARYEAARDQLRPVAVL